MAMAAAALASIARFCPREAKQKCASLWAYRLITIPAYSPPRGTAHASDSCNLFDLGMLIIMLLGD